MVKNVRRIEPCFCYGTKESACFALTPDNEKVRSCDGKRIFCPFYKPVKQVEEVERKAKARAEANGQEFVSAFTFREEYCD